MIANLRTSRFIAQSVMLIAGVLLATFCPGYSRAQSATNTFPDNGNVGIGTTSPGEALSLNGGALGAYYYSLGYGIRGIFNHSGNGSGILSAGGLQIASQGTNNAVNGSGDINFFVTSSNSAGAFTDGTYTQAVKIRYNGNVGIGTTSPYTKLQINGIATISAGDVDANNIDGLRFQTASGNSYLDNHGGHTYFRVGAGSSENAAARTVMTFDNANGNVGIGTTSGYSKLQVAGGDISIDADHAIRKAGDNSIIAYSSSLPGIVVGSGTATDQVIINAGGSERARILSNGNVGIGTTSPIGHLNIKTATNKQLSIREAADFGGLSNAVAIHAFNDGAAASIPLSIESSTLTLNAATNGNVGIGKTDPGYKLDVNGTVHATNIVATYQDVAEWVPSAEQLSAGTVVVLDSTKSNQVTSSTVSYDTRVAGVVSEQPGIALGEKSDGKVLVATTGRVRVKVDATKGPIHIGDLLVTSDVPGVAMKSEAVNLGGVQFHRPGTLIGKALEPLEKGKGEILVLLSLQ